jgi:hypothetical protein
MLLLLLLLPWPQRRGYDVGFVVQAVEQYQV